MPFTPKNWINGSGGTPPNASNLNSLETRIKAALPAFSQTTWSDPTSSTPISEAALEDLETRVTDYAETSGLPGFFVVTDAAYGAAGDGGIGVSGITGTDDTAAWQAACDAAEAAGGGCVYVPGGRAYRINGGVEVPKGVYLFGTPGYSSGGPNPSEATDWYNDVTGQFVVPPSALPTILVTSTTTSPIKLFGSGAGIENFAFLYPAQIKPPSWAAGSPTVYPAAINATSSANGHFARNIVDYNSYVLIDFTAGADKVIENIVSSPHLKIIECGADEYRIDGVHHNQGTFFEVGVNKKVAGPLIDLSNAGPGHLSHVGINGDGSTTLAIKVTSTWGFRLSDVWIDQCLVPLQIVHPSSSTFMGQMTNVEIGKGNQNPSSIQLAGQQGSGGNICTVQASNSIFGTGLDLSTTAGGGGLLLASNCSFYQDILVAGPTSGGDALTLQLGNCGLGDARFTGSGTGRVRAYLSNCRKWQNFPNCWDTPNSADLVVIDRDAMVTQHFHIAEGVSLAAGQNHIGHLIPRRTESGGNTQFVIYHAEGYIRDGTGTPGADRVEVGSGSQYTLSPDPLKLFDGADSAPQTSAESTPRHDPPYGTIDVGHAFKVNANANTGDRLPVYYNNQHGSSHTVPAGGYDIVITYCATPL